MQQVDQVTKDVGSIAAEASERLVSAFDELAKEVRRATRPEPRMPIGLVAVVTIGLVALALAILVGLRTANPGNDAVDESAYP